MKRYEHYKDIGLPWYSNGIPSDWTVVRHKNVLTEHKEYVGNNATEYTLLSLTMRGVIVRDLSEGKGKFSKDFNNYVVVNPGDFVFCLFDVDETPRTVGLSEKQGMITGAYNVFSTHGVNPRYFYYYYLALDNAKVLKPLYTGLRKVISLPAFLSMKVPLPPDKEQTNIVRYLDWKTSEIERLIQGLQSQIKLLDEKKLTLINNAVTLGIHHDQQMQAVEANWFDRMPSHWKYDKIKQHFHIQKEIAGKEGYDVISITQQGLKIKDISSNEGQIAASYAKYQFVHPGDFAMNHMDLLTGFVGISKYFGVTSPDYRVFVLDDTEHCDPQYYLYIFELGYKRKIFYGLGRGAANKGRWRMPAENFNNFEIPVPPLEEQKEIVSYLQSETKKITDLTEGLKREIELLQEYRTRLISDVVTGQVDVRNVKIPDYVPEQDDAENALNETDIGEVDADAE